MGHDPGARYTRRSSGSVEYGNLLDDKFYPASPYVVYSNCDRFDKHDVAGFDNGWINGEHLGSVFVSSRGVVDGKRQLWGEGQINY